VTELLDRDRRERIAGRLPARLDALRRAADLATGRVSADLVAQATRIRDRAGERLSLVTQHTVVALAGSTGSGKSSLFNAIVGLDLARVGVRRPTTSVTLACTFGPADAGPLLDWLGVEPQRQVRRASVLEDFAESDLQGLVLLDLPDHDSTEAAHAVEVGRLVELVDLLVWVVDPQKYADAAVHDSYLRPLAGHDDAVVVVLNHTDRLTRASAEECAADLRTLLAADGLGQAPVLLTSAATGAGVPRLRALLAERVLRPQSYASRLDADLGQIAAALLDDCGDRAGAPVVDPAAQRQLVEELAGAVGRDALVRSAVEAADRRGNRKVSTTVGGRAKRSREADRGRPEPSAARVAQAVRAFSERIASQLAEDESVHEGWVRTSRAAARANLARLPVDLEATVAGTDLSVPEPRAWSALAIGRWVALIGAAGATVWLAASAVASSTPELSQPWFVPGLLVAVGLVAWVVLGTLGRRAVRARSARLRAELSDRVDAAVGAVAAVQVVAPVAAEFDRLGQARAALADALRRR
jgi:GTP-binding protein EngB required for normal cell division